MSNYLNTYIFKRMRSTLFFFLFASQYIAVTMVHVFPGFDFEINIMKFLVLILSSVILGTVAENSLYIITESGEKCDE